MLKILVQQRWTRLSNTLRYKPIYLYLIFFLLGFIIYKYWYVVIISIALFVLLHRRLSFIICTILTLIPLVGLTLVNNIDINYFENERVAVVVSEPTKKDYSYLYVIESKNEKYLMYYSTLMPIGTKIKVKGSIKLFKEQMIPNGFDLKEYYLGKNIKGELKVSKLTVIGKESNLNTFSHSFINLFGGTLTNYLNGYLFGNFDDEGIEFYNDLGIIRILVISGINIIVLIQMVKSLLKLLNANKLITYISLIGIQVLLLLISGFSMIVLRIVLINFLSFLNKYFRLYRLRIDVLSIAFILLLSIFPYLIYSQGMIITLIILFGKELIQFGSKNHSNIIFSFICPLLILPFISDNKIYLLSFALFPLFYYLSKYFLSPIFLVSLIAPYLKNPISFVLSIFEYVCEKINYLNFALNIPNFNIFAKLLYYSLLILVLISTNKKSCIKRIMISVFSLTLFISQYSFIFMNGVYFLNVGQGDGTVIVVNSRVVVIDCFTNTYDFLNRNNLKTVDLLFLTHNDLDHYQDAQEIIENLNVRTIILSPYSRVDYVVDNGVKYQDGYKGGKYNFFDYEISILSPSKNYGNDNDNGLVLMISDKKTKILMMGDASIAIEQELIKTMGKRIEADIIKIGHHGSKTSTSLEFLKAVGAKSAIISCGLNNKFGFPHESIIDNLSMLEISTYITSDGNSYKWSMYGLHPT
jgi:competence protein ComEC